MTAELSGFKKLIRPGIVLEVNQVARVDLTLEIGEITEQVEVLATAPVLQTDTTIVGTVVSSTTTPNLPLNGRNFIQLTLLSPGVVATNPSSFTNGLRTSGGGRPYVNGNRKEANNFQLDGIDNNQTSDNLTSYQPNVDAIQEFKLITNNAPAEFGNFQGGIINITLKSGTNEFHGNVFEFLRNDKLNANNWARNWSGIPRQVLRHNVFGGTFGGPIMKNKLFFFADYQGTRRRPGFGGGRITLIPEAFRRGDFSAFPQQLYDPLTTRPDPTTGQFVRDPFPGNIIPQSRINPVARNLFADTDIYPLPTSPGLTLNYVNEARTILDNDQGDVRIDSKLSDRDDFFARYSHGLQETLSVNTTRILMGGQGRSPFRALALGWTRTFSPRVVNEARIGFNRIVLLTFGGVDLGNIGNLGEKIGIPGSNERGPGLPQISFGGAATPIGSTRNVQNFYNNTFQYGDNISIIHGRHTIKTGVQVLRYQQNTYYSGNNGQLGLFDFNGQYTRDLTNPASRGNGIADFFLGYPSRLGRGVITGTWGHRSTLWAGFIQDDWRARPNLTFNIGLRYEYRTPLVEVRDRQANWDLRTGKQLFAGKDGNSRGLYRGYKRDWQPRFGFAWTPEVFKGKTVIRGAYTISSFMEGTGTNLRLPLNPPFSTEFETLFTDPAVLGTTIDQGFTALRAADPFRGAILRAWQEDIQPARVQQWNLTLEQQLTSDITVSAGYVGQRGTHLVVPINFNQPRLGTTVRPFDHVLPQIQFVVLTASWADQRYDSLQVQGRKRFSKGLEFLASYTLSKGFSDAIGYYGEGGQSASQSAYWADPYNKRAEWGPTYFDVRHAFTYAYVYDLPFGKGRRYLSNIGRAANLLLGGWSMSGILQLHTGFPITVLAPDQSLTGSRTGRPDRTADGKGQRIVGREGNWFDTSAFVIPRRGTFGNAGIGILRGPGLKNFDLSIMKKFSVTESKYFELRTEFFNLTNTPIFNAPDRSITSVNFGKVLSSQLEREIQFALKFHF